MTANQASFAVSIDHRSHMPVYIQVMNGLEDLVYRCVLKPGDRLPAVRELAQKLDINPNTVARAYRELEQRDVLNSRVGRGTFLSDKVQNDEEKFHQKILENSWATLKRQCTENGVPREEVIKFLTQKINSE